MKGKETEEMRGDEGKCKERCSVISKGRGQGERGLYCVRKQI